MAAMSKSFGFLAFLLPLCCSANLTTGHSVLVDPKALITSDIVNRNCSHLSPIPSNLSQCAHLQFLEMAYNSLDGGIPTQIGKITALQGLQLGGNKINGTLLMQSIGNLHHLIVLGLKNNQIVGGVPTTNIFNQTLALNMNKLVGKQPRDVGNLTELKILDLSFNYFTGNELSGSLPNETCKMLPFLGINKLSGQIPSHLSRCEHLQFLGLSYNWCDGRIPAETRDITALQVLQLGGNKLNEGIGNLRNLVLLALENNEISARNLTMLRLLELITSKSNHFTGGLPKAMGQLEDLWLGEIFNISTLSLPLSGPLPNNLCYASLVGGNIPPTTKYLRATSSIWSHSSLNYLSGEIPDGGPLKNFTKDTPCRSISRRRSERKKVGFALFVVAGVVVLITIVSVVLIITRCGRKGNIAGRVDGLESVVPERISYYDIMRATECFSESNLLGNGSFGSVFFRGVVRDGRTIAVKVFSLQSEAALRSFDVECEVLRNIRHRNLVKVISCCSNEGFKALVLKYMPKGNLEKWLYSHNHCLDLVQRLNIMIDVASALEYLHHGCSTPIVHCDLKPSNVWLDEEMTAHVSDFGIAKLLGTDESNVLANTLATTGYTAPEYSMKGLVSTKCDVYSYGIMLMETFTRKRPGDDMFGGELSLRSWVESQVTQEVMDGNLVNPGERGLEKKLKCVSSVLSLGLQCAAISSGDRISMKQAVAELQKIEHQLLYRKQRTGF